jgi:hypothetical protein
VSAHYEIFLDSLPDARLLVDFKTVRGEVVDYAVVLLLVTIAGKETVRVYDGRHGFNEMHRYTRAGEKRDGTKFHSGTLDEGKDAAIDAIKRGYGEMIEGWRAQ